jgi:hypothetical protein
LIGQGAPGGRAMSRTGTKWYEFDRGSPITGRSAASPRTS